MSTKSAGSCSHGQCNRVDHDSFRDLQLPSTKQNWVYRGRSLGPNRRERQNRSCRIQGSNLESNVELVAVRNVLHGAVPLVISLKA